MKKGTLIIWLGLLFIGICAFFWHNEWRYSLPTPVPQNYKAVASGEYINLTSKIKSDTSKPVFMHFFNPVCPCSRFNITHFKSLVKQYDKQVNFVIVVMSTKEYTAREIQNKFDIKLPVLFDSSIAASCGVYSTPQAVIIDTDHKLRYRGNYNRSRYCADKKTEYARIALDSLIHHNPDVIFDQFALKAYGCQLPKNCTK